MDTPEQVHCRTSTSHNKFTTEQLPHGTSTPLMIPYELGEEEEREMESEEEAGMESGEEGDSAPEDVMAEDLLQGQAAGELEALQGWLGFDPPPADSGGSRGLDVGLGGVQVPPHSTPWASPSAAHFPEASLPMRAFSYPLFRGHLCQ